MQPPPSPEDPRVPPGSPEGQVEDLQSRLQSAQEVLDSISEAIYIQDAEGRFLEVNEGAARMYGYPRDFFIGKTPEFLSPPGLNEMGPVRQAVAEALGGEPQQFEFWGLKRDGTIFPKEVRLYPGLHRGQQVVIATARDISQRKQAERIQGATYRIAEAAIESRDIQELFSRVHGIIRDLMPAENLYFALWDKTSDTVSFPYWVDQEDPAPAPRRLRRGLTEYVLRTGKPLLIDEAGTRRLEAAGEVEALGTPQLDWLGVPLKNDSGVFGALVVQTYHGGHRFTDLERDLLLFVSGQVSMAMDRTRSESERRVLTAAMDLASDPVFGSNAEGRFVFVNRAACTSLGYSREEFLQMSIWDVDPEVAQVDWPARWSKLQTHGSNRQETRHRRKDGSVFPVEISSSFLTLDGREMTFTNVRNISSRKAADDALRASEEKFSRAFQATPDAINLTRLDGTLLDVNEAFSQMSGWTREEAIGRTTLDLGLWVDLADRTKAMELIRKNGRFNGLEATFRMKDGSTRIGLLSGTVIHVEGEPCMLSLTRDISVRKAVEQALRMAERKLRTVLSNSQAIIYQLDSAGRFTLSEGLGLVNLGLQPGEAVGRSAQEMYHLNPRMLDQISRGLQGESTRDLIQVSGRILDNILTPVFDDHGHLESLIGIATDCTDRQRAEEALLAERGLFVGGPVMVIKWRVEEGSPVDYVSPNIETILGYAPEDLISGRISYDSLVHPEDVTSIHKDAAAFRARGMANYEQQYRLRTAAGEYRWFYDFTASSSPGPTPSHIHGYLLDITDRQRTEETLRHTQKLESLGVLAGGIAHDFNNLLTVVLGNLNLAQMQLQETSPALPYLAKMEATILRATELTKQMLAYSGRGHFNVKAHDLNAVVRDLTHLLEVSISKKVHLLFDLEPNLPAIQADVAQLQQVVMNLVTNASDAIGDWEGAIHITTSTEDLDEQVLRTRYRVESPIPGEHVILEVEDTGSGMSPEVRERIFDPFFTTKTTGRGLGLSAMLGILRGHRSGMEISSEVGRGSVFRLCFPAVERPLSLDASGRIVSAEIPMHGQVLLVDDEPQILQAIGSALASFGFQVVPARDGMEALDHFREHLGNLDLVLMDLNMPRMDGREAFCAMRSLAPEVPVVLSSGYTELDALQAFPDGGPAGFLQKPYQIKELRATLQRVLGG